MTGFRQPFSERIKDNRAENKFREVFPNAVKIGWDNHNIPWFYEIPSFVRSVPDFMVERNGQVVFYEVKGFAGELKLKFKDFNNLEKWSWFVPLFLFAYDSVSDSWVVEDWSFVKYLVEKGEHGSFRYDDSKNNCFVIKKWW